MRETLPPSSLSANKATLCEPSPNDTRSTVAAAGAPALAQIVLRGIGPLPHSGCRAVGLGVEQTALLEQPDVGRGRIVDKLTGLRVTHPYPLDGTGKKKPNPDDAPAELEFWAYEERSWSNLYF